MVQNSVNIPEAELVSLLQKGDTTAMRTLYDRTVGYLRAVCSRYILNDDDVQDILQDSFVKVFTSIGKFKYTHDNSLRGWMSKIVVNESLKFLKESKQTTSIEDDGFVDVADDEPDPENVPAEVIQQMIRELPAGYRAVFNLYVFEDKSHSEIASLLGIKEDSSASQLHRAKSILSKKINDYKAGRYGRKMEK